MTLRPNARWLAGAFAAIGAITVFVLLPDASEDATRGALRATARTSFLLFTAFFLARASRPWERRLFSAFAASHAIHLGLILWLARVAESPFELTTVVFGGLGYLAIGVLLATSPGATFVRIAVYYLWFVFFAIYAGTLVNGAFGVVIPLTVLLASLPIRIRSDRTAAS